MKKRGQVETFPFVAYIVIAILVLIPLLFFVSSSINGNKTKEQILAKQIVLLINNAEPNTIITISTNNLGVSIDGNTITVKGERSAGYSYDFFSNNKVELESKDEILTIKIGEKNV